MRQPKVTWTDPHEAHYWRAVRETVRDVFHRDPSLAAPLERAVHDRPEIERQAFYNTEPLDVVADFLEEEPTGEQREAYGHLLATLTKTPDSQTSETQVERANDIASSRVESRHARLKQLASKPFRMYSKTKTTKDNIKSALPKKNKAYGPAVPISESVTPEYIICLEDGEKLKMLKRHLWNTYGMSPEEYRKKWGLPKDYPMIAPNYASTPRTISPRPRSKSG